MHVINFLIAILLPYIGIFSKLAPPGAVPAYFFSEEAAMLAGEFNVMVFFWAGFLRNYISARRLTEQKYFLLAGIALAFICVSKIIFTLPYTWITSIFAFGLGVLAVPKGQTVGKITLSLMVLTTIFIMGFSAFILLGMAWFGFAPADYYYYKALLTHWF